jgi:hypothetical protein
MMKMPKQVSLELVLKVTMYAILVAYSFWGVKMLSEAQLYNFENIYFRLTIISLLVLSASYDPVVCLLLAIAFLMTHERLQEVKKMQTNNKVNDLQEQQNNKIRMLKKMNNELKENNNHLNMIVSEKLNNINQPFQVENTSELKELSQDNIDSIYNYMDKSQVVDAVTDVNTFFEAEKSFDRIGSNYVN